ncbi:Cation-independent mannose-6-phosphate receptor CI-MPR [Ophidiomyces ophidiicola]|uniref:Cation-independent mannose-6-phosphate receptor CI-MPR n=1 Tax=Ophidiomyces ophidiicola TaxID=1387563 RepID=A0ACB8UW11_9EURO|nr:Cation-independent mannose-6-phosphate receptor CI-MPR [Ophidiomyces ophidiicola]KAI1946011.1 Cation-independent mannose-6-phosphate receptor CI-MPR [Ophidiomyces ophidiicola]KAI1949808.1 Cation-independent mannose-6-phosphate receptor CI-MPR [Ophidiomyces ophidiicola]KAI1957115.1 Cation-independent mannose-6-phosphate receptor CI-MPR [Ophidiomyces ophidiicola]KAI1971821.1 Cation-independent mannose-6-phosphate receptor CI-MPR [Ophidiomyces ophidiicola]KAI2017209.1 Cation-independent mannos
MHISTPRVIACLFQLSFFYTQHSAATEDKTEKKLKPCTIYSPNTGAYFDLNTITLSPPETKDGKKVRLDDREDSWHARGYDYGANFTINFCAPVIEKLQDVVGVEKERWQNVSAFYKLDGKTYSIGQQATDLVFRGRKLVLNYTDGSPCPATPKSKPERALISRNPRERSQDDDEDNEDDDKKGDEKKGSESERKKSTIMSFLCDRDLVSPAVAASYVGTIDSCTYFFEIRSAVACGGVATNTDGGVGPAGVFGIIAGIAIAAYLIGGCAYQRTVMHQRGWRQCPNFAMWNGMLGFVKDMAIILFSSVLGCFKSSGGYTRLPLGQDNGNSHRRGLVGAIGGRGPSNSNTVRGRRHDVDEENRLIDQLDEEWED